MKKLFLMAVMALFAISASAQVDEGFRSGFQANLGISNLSGKGDSSTLGYGVSWIAEYNFTPNVFIKSGIGLENIAHKEKLVDGTINAYYAQLPINIGYRFPIGDTSSMFVQAGPTVSYGVFGSKLEWTGGGSSNVFDILDRFDVGVGGRIGVEFSKLQLSVGANYGLIAPVEGYHNLSINLGIGFMF